jgi:hypothetical protein
VALVADHAVTTIVACRGAPEAITVDTSDPRIAQGAMWADVIVVLAPSVKDVLRLDRTPVEMGTMWVSSETAAFSLSATSPRRES